MSGESDSDEKAGDDSEEGRDSFRDDRDGLPDLADGLLFSGESISGAEGETSKKDDFIQLFNAHRREILVYLATLLPTQSDVDDVFQEASLVLWREFDKFQIGTNFTAWATMIAFNRVRAWRTQRSREVLTFSNALLHAISDDLMTYPEYYQERLQALDGCVENLKSRHREILRRRYLEGLSIESIAELSTQTTAAVYRMLSRIRQILLDCVRRKVVDPRGVEPL